MKVKSPLQLIINYFDVHFITLMSLCMIIFAFDLSKLHYKIEASTIHNKMQQFSRMCFFTAISELVNFVIRDKEM